MFKHSAAFLAILLPLHAAAAEPAPRTITVDGLTIVYRSSLDADGILHLRGRTAEGEALHFRVAPSGRLTGFVGERVVDTWVSRSQRARAVESVSLDLAAARSGTR